jgi:hypothetical protein
VLPASANVLHYKYSPEVLQRDYMRIDGRLSMIELIPSTPRDITIVAAQMREWDRREFEASAAYPSATHAALLCHYGSQPWAAIALLDGDPVAAFGAFGSPLMPQLRTAWAFGTERFRRAVPAITREVESWKPQLVREGVHRIEARALAGHDLAGRWLKGLGASRETILKRYGTGGEDFELWAWVAETN